MHQSLSIRSEELSVHGSAPGITLEPIAFIVSVSFAQGRGSRGIPSEQYFTLNWIVCFNAFSLLDTPGSSGLKHISLTS